MKPKNTLTINGKTYDARTGLLLSVMPKATNSSATPHARAHSDDVTATLKLAHQHPSHPSHVVHKKPARSTTLRRNALKKPQPYHAPTAPAKSPMISRFGTTSGPRPKQDIVAPAHAPAAHRNAALNHPSLTNAPHHTPARSQPATATEKRLSQTQKEHIVSRALAAAPDRSVSAALENHRPKVSLRQRLPRLASVGTMSLALVILGAYLTYVNMPSLSVRVASAQAGVNATFPQYHPDGYGLDGPVAYAPGEVTITYKANSNRTLGYTISQRASNWDSQAVLDNYVKAESKSYQPYSEQGLTIYTYNNKATWVNGGILYTIKGNAPLSPDQVLRIAGSL